MMFLHLGIRNQHFVSALFTRETLIVLGLNQQDKNPGKTADSSRETPEKMTEEFQCMCGRGIFYYHWRL